jgi:hypothetical protein
MDSLRFVVAQRGQRYVARCDALKVWAIGATAERAAENARTMVLSTENFGPRLLTLRIEEPGMTTLVIQPLHGPIVVSPLTRGAALLAVE